MIKKFMRKEGGGGLPFGVAKKMPEGFTVGVFLFLLIGLSVVEPRPAAAGLADHVVINEVQTNSGSGGADYDDWVELYNPTATSTSLSGWSIQKTNASGGSLYRKVLNGIIPAGGYYLIVRDNDSTTQSLKNLADVLAAGSSSGLALTDNNIVYLVNNNEDMASSTDSDIIDFVGFGSTASYYEGSAPALNPAAGKSIARTPDGEDSNNNSLDFALADNPTPKSGANPGNDDDLGGTVLLTITPDAVPVQNINSTGAQIVFQVNAAGSAIIKYGLNTGYASSTISETVTANTTTTVSLTDLACATTYHYVIYAEGSDPTKNDTTSDAVFTTLPCGITVDSLVMTKSSAKANNQYEDGWQWEFNITVWNMSETSLKMKFNQWTGAGTLDAGANMQYSVDNGVGWHDITANAAYPDAGASLSGIDNGAGVGRQVKIIVRMKVPVGTVAGYYNSNYGILTE